MKVPTYINGIPSTTYLSQLSYNNTSNIRLIGKLNYVIATTPDQHYNIPCIILRQYSIIRKTK